MVGNRWVEMLLVSPVQQEGYYDQIKRLPCVRSIRCILYMSLSSKKRLACSSVSFHSPSHYRVQPTLPHRELRRPAPPHPPPLHCRGGRVGGCGRQKARARP